MEIPERVVRQYLTYCEKNVVPLSCSTLLRIPEVFSASNRKSMQGLDYVTSSGAQAFDDLMGVAEKLWDAGEGMDWAKDVCNRLHDAKRYLKGDYKVKNGIIIKK